MGHRTDHLNKGALRARRAARLGRARSSLVLDEKPSATVLGPQFRDETEMERELKELEAERQSLESDLAQIMAEKEDSGEADLLRREIERLEGEIVRERKQEE